MICRELNCLFVHVPKAAGRSIEAFFMQRLGMDRDNDADRQRLLIIDNPDPDRGTEKLAHLSAAEYLECGYLTQQEFSSFFKFAFVRNPWARLVSEYRYRNYFRHRNFKDFIMHKLPPPGRDDKYRHVMPQTDMLYDSEGRLMVDFVGKFENLQADFDQVCARLGFDSCKLPHVNSSDKPSRELKRKLRNSLYRNRESELRSYVDFYDAETREFVGELYRRDVENFAYNFEDALHPRPQTAAV